MFMTIAVANDHASVDMKNEIIRYLSEKGIMYENLGTDCNDRCDYPVFAQKIGKLVADGSYDRGILICGSGAGMCISANKVKGIRAVVCTEPYTAKMSREHNNSNVLCFGSRVIGPEMAKMIVDTWLEAGFEGGRHQVRIDMVE